MSALMAIQESLTRGREPAIGIVSDLAAPDPLQPFSTSES
jgi:hypothetical protein